MMRNFYIKTQILFLILIAFFYKGQDNSISAFVQTPVANQTGVPDISFPLVSLPAAKDFTLNFGIVYNPNSYLPGEFSGNLGRNWMLSGSNFMITRKLGIGYWTDEHQHSSVPLDNVYFYNLNGEQGSFKFERTGVFPDQYVYTLKKLTHSNIKIEFEREDSYYKYVTSFTIVDSKGYKYYFQDYSFNGIGMLHDRNAFYINKIEDSSGKQIVTFENKMFTNTDLQGTVVGRIYIPEKITSDYGKIILEHGIDEAATWSFHDRFYFKNFILKDHKNNFITEYKLEMENGSYRYQNFDLYGTTEAQVIKERKLNGIKKLDKNSNTIEKTNFGYTYVKPQSASFGNYIPPNCYQKNDFLLNGLLSSVTLPSGGRIQYQYGKHSLKLDPPLSGHSIIKQKTDSIAYDSYITKKYYLNNIQKSPTSKIWIAFIRNEIYPYPPDPENPWRGQPNPKLAYKIKNYIYDFYNGAERDALFAYSQVEVPSDGSAYLEITGSGGNGWFIIYEEFLTDYTVTLNSAVSNSGVKIEQINYFDKINYDVKKTINYDYTLFDEPGVSSGIAVPDDQKEAIIYRNVKVTESDKPGYTKYYYKTPFDFPRYPPVTGYNVTIWPNYNLTKKGLLGKKEIFNTNNIPKSSLFIDYSLPTYDISRLFKYYLICSSETCPDNYESEIYTHDSFPEKITTTETSYDSAGNSLTSTTEKTFNQQNNNLMKEKKTMADGTVMETEYQYAAEKGNTKLLGASMSSVPLEVTQKQNNTPVGKVETFYDHAGNYFPSSVKSSGINGAVINEEKNDIYDTMGNVLQSTSKTGIPTAYIYGYNGTLLIAKIEGLQYSEVMTAMGQPATIEAYKNLEIYTQSNLDIDDISEETLRLKLDAFRLKPAFKNYQITTYTYDPLIGTKSVTSPSGNKEYYYYYDDAHRMIRVEDINHNVIKENKYKQNLVN